MNNFEREQQKYSKSIEKYQGRKKLYIREIIVIAIKSCFFLYKGTKAYNKDMNPNPKPKKSHIATAMILGASKGFNDGLKKRK